MLTLLNRLWPGSFKDLLVKWPAKTMNEIQVKAEKYIYLEETQKAIANTGKNQGMPKLGS